MTVTNLGTLEKNPVFRQGFLSAGEKDFFIFDVTSGSTYINLGLKVPPDGNTRMFLYKDNDLNGGFNAGDESTGSIAGGSGDAMIHARSRGAGRYIAEIRNNNNASFSYELRATASKPSQIHTTKPFSFNNLGLITFDRGPFSRGATNRETTQTYTFSLGTQGGVNISIFDLTGDVDLRVIKEINKNGVVDANEVTQVSAKGGTTPDSITVTGAGDYVLQVYQFAEGNQGYNLLFDAF
jgi:hypothetical protein